MITIYCPPKVALVAYPLVAIDGTVESKLDDTIIAYNTATYSRTIWPVVQNDFKCFVLLASGLNIIRLQHGYLTTTLDITRNCEIFNTNYLIQPLYVIFKGSNGMFDSPEEDNSPASALRRISLACALLQTFTAVNISKLLSTGPNFTFQFHYDSITNLPRCEIFHSRYSINHISQLSEMDLWKLLAKELIDSDLPHIQTTKYIMFLSNTRYSGQNWKPSWKHRDIVAATQGYIAIGGGGLAVVGTATLHTWAEGLHDLIHCLTDETEIDKTILMDDSAYRGTYWANYATGLGALLHEIGHTLDLSHTSSGIMARGDNIHTFFILNGAKPVEQATPFDHLESKLTRPHPDACKGAGLNPSNVVSVSQLTVIPNLEIYSTLHTATNCSASRLRKANHSSRDQSAPVVKYPDVVEPEEPFTYSSYHQPRQLLECSQTDSSNWSLSSAVMLRYSRWLLPAEELKQSCAKPFGTCSLVKAEAGVRTVQIYCRCFDVIISSEHYITDPPPYVVHPARLMNSVQHKSNCDTTSCLEAHIRDSAVHHRLDVKLNMWSTGLTRSKDLKVTPLSEAAAIDIGAEMLSEAFVFFVGASIIGMEYWRQSANSAKKEQKQDDNLVQLRKDINSLNTIVKNQREQMDRLSDLIVKLDTKGIVKLMPADPIADRKTLKPR